MIQLEKVYNQVFAELANRKAETVLLSSDQMLVSRNMMTNPEPSGFKTPSQVPAPDGYAIYVRVRSPGADQGRPQQRVSSPRPPVRSEPGTKLRLNRTTLDQSWGFLNQDDELISIAVNCGSEQVFEEVDWILGVLTTFLLGSPLESI